ncbi:hypothetical protein ES705_36517 [subsurface metagenome]
MNSQILKSYDESIARLERLGRRSRKPVRSDEGFQKAFNQTSKELKEIGNKLILQKATEAMEQGGLTWHELEVLEAGLKKGRRVSPDFLRSLGIDLPGKPTRKEALAVMGEALEKGEITFREFTRGEDALNKKIETPVSILKALETRRTKDSESSEDERLSKAEKRSPTIHVSERREIPLSVRMSPQLSGEAEILVQNDEQEPWIGKMVSRSFRGRFI